ncbi:MAG: alpha/beta fold hydrolase [Acidimicrobiia bacterium]|nr:alpha/beta fold hydrolase [Acidimicrobiia bacterium]
MTTLDVLPGAEPMSHIGDGDTGVLVLHGFTGNPSSLRRQATTLAARGHHVEAPRLPGHGTTVEEMLTTGWSDWSVAALDAYDQLAERAGRIVVMGLSMGGTLTLWTALRRPDTLGIVCVNPVTEAQPDEVLAMVAEMIDDGNEVMPGVGSDIADPDAVEIAYDGTPLRPLLSFVRDGVTPIADRYDELKMPLLLFTSHNDHVVEPHNSEHLAATHGGDVEHVWLDRSFHVATQDHDRDAITEQAAAFVARVTDR